MCLMCFSFGLSCLGLSALPGLRRLIPFLAREVFSYYCFKYFLKLLSQRSLRRSSFLFILFCFLGVIFTILSSKPIICSSSVALLLIPCNVIFHFSHCIVLFCLFFSSSRSFLNISCIFSTYASHFSPKSWIIFTSLLWILFPFDCLSPLHLVVLLGFYLVPSSGMHSFPISFCLTFCDCSFYSTGCNHSCFYDLKSGRWG